MLACNGLRAVDCLNKEPAPWLYYADFVPNHIKLPCKNNPILLKLLTIHLI
jgi:hypothetical protein